MRFQLTIQLGARAPSKMVDNFLNSSLKNVSHNLTQNLIGVEMCDKKGYRFMHIKNSYTFNF